MTDEAAAGTGTTTSEEEFIRFEELQGEAAAECQACSSGGGDIKAMLMRKYSGYISNLKKEFLKKRKKGKLPKDARTTLMDWWNAHYRWPYPTVPTYLPTN